MTQSDLAEDICSTSHLSKLENGSYEVNRETLILLLERLKIDLNTESRKIKEIKDAINQFIDALYHVDKEEISKGFSKLKVLEDYCLNTDLINIFQLSMFKYYIYSLDFEKAKEMQKVIDKLSHNFNKHETFIYITAQSSLLTQQNYPNEALKLLKSYSFKDELDLNQGEYYYQLALCYSILDNANISIIYCQKANLFFQEQFNFIKIIYNQMTLAINYVRIELFEEAKITYIKILRNSKMLGRHDLYIQNLYNYALLLKHKKEYQKALEYFRYCANNFPKGSENLILCLLNLIDLMIILKKDKNMILATIKEVKMHSFDKKYKIYDLLAQKFKYELMKPNERYYKFLEERLLPNLLVNNKYSLAAETTLELSQYYEKSDIWKSNELLKKYFSIREEHKI